MKIKKLLCSLTVFERWLWGVSAVVIAASYILSGAGDFLTLTASLIGVSALIFVAKGYVAGQVLSVIFAVFYGIISFYFKYYGEMITYLCMSAPAAAFSVVSWLRHPYAKSDEVKVAKLTFKHTAAAALFAVAVTVMFYFILRALGTAKLTVSTVSVFTSFLASELVFLRSPFYGVAYAANDIVLIIMWTLASIEDISYMPMILCFVMFLANDIYGFYNWRRIGARQQNEGNDSFFEKKESKKL